MREEWHCYGSSGGLNPSCKIKIAPPRLHSRGKSPFSSSQRLSSVSPPHPPAHFLYHLAASLFMRPATSRPPQPTPPPSSLPATFSSSLCPRCEQMRAGSRVRRPRRDDGSEARQGPPTASSARADAAGTGASTDSSSTSPPPPLRSIQIGGCSRSLPATDPWR
jgi:hypothetical protein